jgi:sulfonate transport system substrate-binding protein
MPTASANPVHDAARRVLRIAIEEINKIDIWAKVNRDLLAAELAPLFGIPKPVLDLSTSRAEYGTGPVTPEILAEQQRIADTFFDLKLIPRRIQVRDVARSPW